MLTCRILSNHFTAVSTVSTALNDVSGRFNGFSMVVSSNIGLYLALPNRLVEYSFWNILSWTFSPPFEELSLLLKGKHFDHLCRK